MSMEQITGIVRAIFAALGGFILAKGWVSAEAWQWITGGALTIGPAIWSWLSNRPASIAGQAQGVKGVSVTTNSAATPAVVAAVNAAR